jgi:hypothetical protein
MKKLNIDKAINHPGALHRDLNVPEGERIPVSKLLEAAKGDSKTAQRARFALTLERLRKKGKRDKSRDKRRAPVRWG